MTVAQGDTSHVLVLNTKSRWDTGLALGVQTSDTGITLEQYATYATERTLGRTELPPELEVADFTVGQCHILYILDATAHAVWTFDPNQTRFELIDCIAALLVRPTAVAFRPGTLYIADTGYPLKAGHCYTTMVSGL